MFKAWVCIIILAAGYKAGPSITVAADIARQSDCERVGRIAVSAYDGDATFRCVQIMHTPE